MANPLLLVGLLLTASTSAAHGAEWSLTSQSEDNNLTGELSCNQMPISGPFLSCSISITENGAPAKTKQVIVTGGMPAHGHGLPTSPVASPTGAPGEYAIKGLKFNMPGEWVLGFELSKQENSQKPERLLFEFALEN